MLAAAQALGHIDADRANPARWRRHLDRLLPNPDKIGERGHHPAMPYADLPAFMRLLKQADGEAAKALTYTILCASRTTEVLGMTWDELGLDGKLWVIPAERMKPTSQGKKVEHRVPLSDAAVDLLRGRFEARHPKQRYVFPGARPGETLSNMALSMVLRRLGAGEFTVHGFRSSFRDWAADHGVEFEVAEACLAHAVGNSVSRAYLRSTMVARRRPVMEAWAAFVAGEGDGTKVIELRRAP